MEVQWKQIVIDGEEWHYEVSKDGKVRNTETGKLMALTKHRDGYLRVGLSKNNKTKYFKVHRLVAIMFIPNPENKPEVNHLDENKTNNCVENLQWCTRRENMLHGTALQRARETTKRNRENNCNNCQC